MTDLVDELVQICRVFSVFEKEQICCGTVTVPQCVVLQTLLKGPSEAAILAEQTGVSRSAMTRLLDGLERKGWVARSRDATDRRHVALSLTPAGDSEAKRLRQLTQQSIDGVLSQIPEGKRAQVAESITLIREALSSARSKIVCC